MIAPDSNTRVRRWRAQIQERRNLGVGVNIDKVATELLAFTNINRIRIVLCPVCPRSRSSSSSAVTFTPFGVRQRIQLQRILATRQFFLVSWPSDQPIDVGETPAALGIPSPNLGWHVFVCRG